MDGHKLLLLLLLFRYSVAGSLCVHAYCDYNHGGVFVCRFPFIDTGKQRPVVYCGTGLSAFSSLQFGCIFNAFGYSAESATSKYVVMLAPVLACTSART
jgi:hypothetical protein